MINRVGHKKPILWITIIGVLITVPVAYLVIAWTRANLLNSLNQRALDELKVHMAHMQSEIDHRYTITRIVAADERVLSFMIQRQNTDAQVQINNHLKRFKDAAGSIAYLLDLNGTVVASGNWDQPDSLVGYNLGFRPYVKASIEGKDSQYVAIGTVSNRLGYYVSIPIQVGKKIVGVAVTKTNPQDLIMTKGENGRPLIITDSDGVAIISSSTRYLYHILERDAVTGAGTKRISRFLDMNIQPITSGPVEKIGRLQLISLPTAVSNKGHREPREYLWADANLSKSDWKAHILWPTEDLDTLLAQRRLITILALILAWLLAFYTVERWQHLKQIKDHAFRDPLTRLYSRLYMLESATALLAAHDRRSITGVSAIMFDLDRFKAINDQYGHSAGDNVLVQVAGVISKECRESDIAIRYGGEEFLVFVPSGDHQQVLQLAERIRLQIKTLDIKLAGQSVHLTISGGIAAHMPGESLEKLIDRADHMMYLAKENGRDQITPEDFKG